MLNNQEKIVKNLKERQENRQISRKTMKNHQKYRKVAKMSQTHQKY